MYFFNFNEFAERARHSKTIIIIIWRARRRRSFYMWAFVFPLMPFHLYECGLTVCVFVFVAGNISTLAALDRESKSRYWLSVYAQDHGVAPLHSRVEVSVNSNYCVTLSIGTSIAEAPLFARNESVPSANTLFCQLLSMNPAWIEGTSLRKFCTAYPCLRTTKQGK